MVSPRLDRCTVAARKPDDAATFDSAVRQPLAEMERSLGYAHDPSDRVYEVFAHESEAVAYARMIRAHGARDVSVFYPLARQQIDIDAWRDPSGPSGPEG